jgi:hypothetical protein
MMAGTPATPVVQGSKPAFSSFALATTSSARDASSPCDPGNTRATFDLSFGKFWVTNDDPENEEDEEGVITTPTKEEIIAADARAGFFVQDLIQAENEIENMEKVSFSSPSSAEFRCPLSSRIVKAIIWKKSLKHHGRPWQGSLLKPRISPPKNLGDTVIKISFIRLLGGQLMPKSFKMALPPTMHGYKADTLPVSQDDQREEWPPLLNLGAPNERRVISAPETAPEVQKFKNREGQVRCRPCPDCEWRHKTWFHPSKGLNVLFSRAGPKPNGIKTSIKEKLNPNRSPTPQPSSHRRHTYAEALKMEGMGSGKGFGNGHREEDDRGRQHKHRN